MFEGEKTIKKRKSFLISLNRDRVYFYAVKMQPLETLISIIDLPSNKILNAARFSRYCLTFGTSFFNTFVLYHPINNFGFYG